MKWAVTTGAVSGRLSVPGDKSIGHRALMLATLATGISRLSGLPTGEDVCSTAACMTALGAEISQDGDVTIVHSSGVLRRPVEALDAGNSGTTMRLLAGILAGQSFTSAITGDDSLRRRPMRRIIEPLRQMGAGIEAHEDRAPLTISGGGLRGIHYRLPVASAQVKSCTLLAGLFAGGETVVSEPVPTRNHTEVMLRGAGVPVQQRDRDIVVAAGMPRPLVLRIPGDISSAAFFLAAGALSGSEIEVRDIGVNPTRTGFLTVLGRMGVQITITDERQEGGEPVATIHLRGRVSRPIVVTTEEVPLLVDELPLVVLLATQAPGSSTITGAEDLRYKESDRIASVTAMLNRLGANVTGTQDGFVIHGATPLLGATVASGGDHRLAMMLAVAGTIAGGETEIQGAEAAAVSYPNFAEDFQHLDGRLVAV